MARLNAGDLAPDFALESEAGTVRLSDFSGRRVVLYFYPKDDTKGCTAQACEYRDNQESFAAADVPVLGISPDSVDSHRKFREKYDLNFTLLSDLDHEVAEAYGVWVEKRMYGRTYMGIERSSFVIGADGRLEQARYKVKSTGDAASALAALG